MRCITPFLFGILLASSCLTPCLVDAEEKANIRILLTTGGHGFQQEPFYAMFDAMEGITYTKAEMPKQADLLRPGLEKDFDCIVMYDMCPNMTAEQQQAFVDLLKTSGIGLVSMHHNLGGHRGWDEFRKIIGGKFIFDPIEIDGKTWQKTPWSHDEDLTITVVDKAHPITDGVEDFEIHDETYGKFWVDPKAHILLTTDHPKNNRQLAWTKTYGKARVYHLMLGHDGKAYANESYQRLLKQGIAWAAGK